MPSVAGVLSPHAFRRAFGSYGSMVGGFTKGQAAMILDHLEGEGDNVTRGHYDLDPRIEEKRALMVWWTGWLDEPAAAAIAAETRCCLIRRRCGRPATSNVTGRNCGTPTASAIAPVLSPSNSPPRNGPRNTETTMGSLSRPRDANGWIVPKDAAKPTPSTWRWSQTIRSRTPPR
jgi:hypothetical protein